MRYKEIDMFGMLTILFTKPVRLIKNLNLNLSRDLNSSSLNLTMIPAINRVKNDKFDNNLLKMDWIVSNQTNLTARILKI